MVKKKAKKKTRKRLTPLPQIRMELQKQEALHEKEEAIVEKITDIIDDEENTEEAFDFDKWEGTDPS